MVGKRAASEFFPFGSRIPADFFHCYKVDNAFKTFSAADGDFNRHYRAAEFLFDILHRRKKIGADSIHFVYKADARYVIMICLPPHRFRLRLNPSNRTKHGNRAVKYAQRALYLGGKVDVPGSIDNVDLMIAPIGCRCGALNGDTPVLFLLHPVHCCSPVIDFSDTVNFSGIKKNTFCCCRFSGIDMRHDADISHSVKHVLLLFTLFSISIC